MVNNHYYFIFSKQQMKILQEAAKKTGRVYTPGTVIVQGVNKPYTELSTKNSSLYSDYVISHRTDNLDSVKYKEGITE